MSKPLKTAEGTWRVFVNYKGRRESRTLPTRREALEWHDKRRVELAAAVGGKLIQGKTLGDALAKYAAEVSPTKGGWRWECLRLAAFCRANSGLPTHALIADIQTDTIAAWRDARVQQVTSGTVLREMGLLSAVFDVARRDWRWIRINPCSDVRKPKQPAHRERLLSGVEVRKMLRKMKHDRMAPVRSVPQAVAYAMLLSLFTGMRAGELCALRWEDVSEASVRLHTSKTGRGRSVPLSSAARQVLARLRGRDPESVLGLQGQTLDSMFRRYRVGAGLSGFTFHDCRHTAATGMARRLHPADLARMFGWASLKQVMTYYNASAADISKQLDRGLDLNKF